MNYSITIGGKILPLDDSQGNRDVISTLNQVNSQGSYRH